MKQNDPIRTGRSTPPRRTTLDATALREVQHRLEQIAALVPGVVYQFKLRPDGTSCFPYASDGIRDIYRVQPDDVRDDASAVFAVLHPDDIDEVSASIRRSAETLEAWRCEYRVKFPEGDVRWLLGHANPARQQDGAVLWHGYISDITERKRADEALRASEEQYRLLVQNANEAIYVVQRGRIVFANPICATLLGLSVDDLLGRRIFEFVPLEAQPQAIDHFERALAGDQSLGLTEFPVRTASGRVGWAEVNSVRVMWNGEPATLNFATDITERRRAQEERIDLERRFLHAQKLESLGVLAGGIAHDFNNLLLAMLGNLDLALHDLDDPAAARPSVEEAMKAARRAAELTRQMLAYSGRGQFVLEDVDLATFVDEVVVMLRAALPKSLSVETCHDRPLPRVRADSGQLQQVVMNLLTNASEAIGDGQGRVSISTSARHYSQEELDAGCLTEPPPPGTFVCLEVADTGCGMDEPTRARLFEPFFTTKFTGRGLGMAALQGILRGHGGTVFVESAPAEGTVIRVLFPGAPEADAVDPLTAAEPAPVSQGPNDRPLVLVVDDEEAVRTLCERTLLRMGCRTMTAADGLEAVGVFERHADEIDLVLLDLTMPKLDGVATLRELRRRRPDARVVLSSGFSEQETLGRFDEEPPAGFIQKPYDLARLRRALTKVLGPRPGTGRPVQDQG